MKKILEIIRKIIEVLRKVWFKIALELQITEISFSKEIIGLFVAIAIITGIFFLPNYAPPVILSPERFSKICAKNGFETVNTTAEQKYNFFESAVEDTEEEFTIFYYVCTEEFYARFFNSSYFSEVYSERCIMRQNGTNEFTRTFVYGDGKMTFLYQNGKKVICVSGPLHEATRLNKLIDKLPVGGSDQKN
ncbi:MAG: hypothetical protein IJF56_02200 [Clostridia bacterium]|nr:hypothetical protein [Clostridia bacterium]